MASRDLDEPHKPKLRMSAAGHCVRELAYAHRGEEQTDPPDQRALNRMAMGHMAEILIVRDLWERGWETAHTVLDPGGQLELEQEIPGAGTRMTGHPDGICRHPDFTKGQWVTLECKSMGPERAKETSERGIAETYPHYITQISLYGRTLHERGLVSHQARGVFAVMDREGTTLPPERVAWNEDLFDQTMAKASKAVTETEQGKLPERPFEPGSRECKYCPYQTLCWGKTPSRGEAPPAKVTMQTDPEVMEAARTWAELKPQVDQARGVLQRTSNDLEMADIHSEEVIAGYFIPRSDRVYDADRLEKLVPGDVLKRCLSRNQPPPKSGFWVRLKNR